MFVTFCSKQQLYLLAEVLQEAFDLSPKGMSTVFHPVGHLHKCLPEALTIKTDSQLGQDGAMLQPDIKHLSML